MDILDLTSSMRNVAHNGHCFNLEEQLQLEMGINELMATSSDTDFEELLFWGKVNGLIKDYYICMGVTYSGHYEFCRKRFYWASSADFKFKAFSELNE